jgi:cellulose 1,4-beta-cellobiosidase
LLFTGLTFGCGGGTSSGSGPATTPAASTVPAAPATLAATAGNQQVTLTWSATSGATTYHVKRTAASGGPYTQVGSVTATSYTDTGLTNGTKYFYVVSALNAAGESVNSSEVSGVPASPAPASTIPAVPTALAATAGNQQVSLTWTASSGATSYHVKRSTVSGGPYNPSGCANQR